MKYYLLPLLLLASCGFNVHVDPIKSDPIQVVHTLNINFDSVLTYCKTKCSSQVDETQVDACTEDCYKNFLDTLTHAVEGLSLPQSIPTGTPSNAN